MNKPEKIECPNCGAPMDARAEVDGAIRCEYCGSSITHRVPAVLEKETVVYREVPVYRTVYRSNSRQRPQTTGEYISARLRSLPTINPDYKEKHRLPFMTGLIVWMSLLGIIALTALGAMGIL